MAAEVGAAVAAGSGPDFCWVVFSTVADAAEIGAVVAAGAAVEVSAVAPVAVAVSGDLAAVTSAAAALTATGRLAENHTWSRIFQIW